MATTLGGFGRADAELRIGALRCADMQIIDRNCNLNITGDATFTNLTVREDLSVQGNITLADDTRISTVTGNGKITFAGDLFVEGTMFTTQDEFTSVVGIGEDDANVLITPIDRYGEIFDTSTVMITECPCSGQILNVDPNTGETLYDTVDANSTIDVYSYSITDTCGLQHSVTQLICRRGVNVPPFINHRCYSFEGADMRDLDIDVVGDMVVMGSKSVDPSSLTVLETLTMTGNVASDACETGAVRSYSYGGPDPAVTITNPMDGTLNVAVNSPDDIAIRLRVQVDDAMGQQSNVAFLWVVSIRNWELRSIAPRSLVRDLVGVISRRSIRPRTAPTSKQRPAGAIRTRNWSGLR